MTSLALKMPKVRRDHTIDYLGAATIVAAVTSILLFTAWAGPHTAGQTRSHSCCWWWGPALRPVPLRRVPRRGADHPAAPVPQPCFTPVIFTAIMGMAMFWGIIFLPVYLQVVQGMSPTESGLALLPMVAGLFPRPSRPANWSPVPAGTDLPILGAAVTGVGIALLSTLGADTPYWQTAIYFFVFGAGLGFTMQIVVTAVQNAVERRDMGSATSSVTFFRSMGAAFGTAIFGAVLTTRLGHYLAESGAGGLPPTADESQIANNVQAIQALPADTEAVVVDAWVRSLHDVFITALPIVTVAFVVAFFIPELTLRGAAPVADTDAEAVMAVGDRPGSAGDPVHRSAVARRLLGDLPSAVGVLAAWPSPLHWASGSSLPSSRCSPASSAWAMPRPAPSCWSASPEGGWSSGSASGLYSRPDLRSSPCPACWQASPSPTPNCWYCVVSAAWVRRCSRSPR